MTDADLQRHIDLLARVDPQGQPLSWLREIKRLRGRVEELESGEAILRAAAIFDQRQCG